MSRTEDLNRFYNLLGELERSVGKRRLAECHGRLAWPLQGVYFFFENGELRPDGVTPRVVRVGTHAVSTGSKTTLWNRLSTHKGTASGGGNHRGSIFRLRVGQALQAREGQSCPTWAQGSSAPRETRLAERQFEEQVSRTLGEFQVLVLAVHDEASPQSQRAYIERNSIGLLSHLNPETDAPSQNWLGNFAQRDEMRRSGLWNSQHVEAHYDPAFLDVLASLVEEQQRRTPLSKA